MSNKKRSRVDSGSCFFLRLPPQLFGERILQHLSIVDILKLNTAITNDGLRKSWWLANEKRPVANAARVLRYAVSNNFILELSRKNQYRLVEKLGIRSKNLRFKFSQMHSRIIDTPSFKRFLDYSGGILERLEINNLDCIQKIRGVSAACVPYLRDLKAISCTKISIECMIDDAYPRQFDESFLNLLAANCRHLEELTLSTGRHCSTKKPLAELALLEILIANASLQSVSLEGYSLNLEMLSALSNASDLTTLQLRKCRFFVHERSATKIKSEHVFSAISSLMPSIQILQIVDTFGCDDFRPDLLMRMLSNCTKSLTSVDLSASFRLQVDDACIDMISARCPQLLHLNVSLDNEIYIRRAEVEWGPVTDASIITLSQRCKQLRTIALRGNEEITSASVEAILNNCSCIEDIDVFFTSDAMRDYVAEKRRELRAEGKKIVLVWHPFDRRDSF